MRQIISQVSLQDAMGVARGDIEARVREEMQQTLDGYRSGVVIQGVAIRQADPPAAVNDAFKEVTAAQQKAQSEVNKANCLRAAASPDRAGRGDRLRQGLRAVPAGARSDQAPHVL